MAPQPETIPVSVYRQMVATKPHVPKKKPVSNKCITQMKLLLTIEGIEFETEVKFHPTRKWRFDIAIPDKKIALEFEGIVSDKSRHTTITGFSNDCEKYNEAAKMGWIVLRYTALTFSNAIKDVKELLENRK